MGGIGSPSVCGMRLRTVPQLGIPVVASFQPSSMPTASLECRVGLLLSLLAFAVDVLFVHDG